jgi:hypothetical protein
VTARGGHDWHDPARGTQTGCDFDDVLRQALHAATDAIEPADDGLTRIMHRLTTPSAVRQVALLVTDCADLARLIAIWLEPAFTGVMRFRRRHHTGHRRGLSHRATGAVPSRPAAPWLRPALAVVGAVAIVVIGVFVLGPGRQIVIRTSVNTGKGASTPAHAGTHSAGGHEQSPAANPKQTVPVRPRTTSARAGRPTPKPSPTIAPSGSPAASPSAGPTPTHGKANHGQQKPHPGKTKSPPPGHTRHGNS